MLRQFRAMRRDVHPSAFVTCRLDAQADLRVGPCDPRRAHTPDGPSGRERSGSGDAPYPDGTH
jgi:hypothetical protein